LHIELEEQNGARKVDMIYRYISASKIYAATTAAAKAPISFNDVNPKLRIVLTRTNAN
jgi:hypothetical protein